MKTAGNTHIVSGKESASPRLLSKMNKKICLEECEEIIKNAWQAKINVRLNFIVGFPGESDADFKCTLDFVKRNRTYIRDIKADVFVLAKKSMAAQYPTRYGIINMRTPISAPFAKYYPDYKFSEANISDSRRNKMAAGRILGLLEIAARNKNIRFFTGSLRRKRC